MNENRREELWNLVSASLARQEWKIALAGLEEILKLEPDNPAAFYNKGIVHCRLGQLDQALANIRHALELKPDHLPSQAALRTIESALQKAQTPTVPILSSAPPRERPSHEIPDIRESCEPVSVLPSATPESASPPITSASDAPSAKIESPSGVIKATDVYQLGHREIHKILPVAEMYTQAGLAIWAVLSLLMIIFIQGRSMLGMAGALVGLVIVFGIFAASTHSFITASRKWIDPNKPTDLEKRIYNSIQKVAAKAGLPLPRVAVAEDDPDINAYTYGLSPDTARVCVTKGFIDHVKPDPEELDAVLAHELSHVYHKDFVISTLLRFPIWLMDKIRAGMVYIRWFAGLILRGFSEVAGGCGIIGLVVILGLLFMMLYLSVIIFLAGVAIFVCVLFLNAFEREREYLADLYSGQLMGNPGPLVRTLAKLEIAGKKFKEEIEKRNKDKKEGEDLDLNVAAPQEAYDPAELIRNSLSKAPSFASSFTEGEFFTDHPLTSKRIYYLHNPLARKRVLSHLFENLCSFGARFLPASDAPQTNALKETILLGVFVGLAMSLLPMAGRWWCDMIMVLITFAGGFGLGYLARRSFWQGERFIRRILVCSFLSSTTLLVVGAIFLNPMAILFPLVFVVLTLINGGFGILGIRFASRAPQQGSSPNPKS